jgi:hypothetical protein
MFCFKSEAAQRDNPLVLRQTNGIEQTYYAGYSHPGHDIQ